MIDESGNELWSLTSYGCDQLNLSHTLLRLVAIVLAKVGINFFNISRNHMSNESRDLVGEIPSP